MTAESFERWVTEMLIPRLPSASVIITDNCTIHSKDEVNFPKSTSWKRVLVEWLQSQGVAVDPGWLRAEVWRQCKARRPEPSYRIDRIFREHGHTVIRTPPYYPIELVWADVKRWLASNNTFKISDLRDLTDGSALAQA